MNYIFRLLRVALSLLLFAALAGAASPAAAQHGKVDMDPVAREHLDKGLEYYGKREYEAALVEFKAGFGIDPRPEFLFAMAQAERLSGDCGSAVVLYREFLATNPPAMHAEAAEGSLTKCETALASRPEGAKGPVGGPKADRGGARDDSDKAELAPDRESVGARVDPGPARSNAGSRGDAGPWYRDTVGVTLLGLGVAGLGVGATFTALSFAAEGDADSAASYQEYQNALDTAESRRAVGYAALGVGTALVAGAAVKYFLLDGARQPGATVAVAPTGQGAAVVWSGRW